MTPSALLRLVTNVPRILHVLAASLLLLTLGSPALAQTRTFDPEARLAELGISHRYREEHGFGHSSRLIGENLPRIFEWFDQHRRPCS